MYQPLKFTVLIYKFTTCSASRRAACEELIVCRVHGDRHRNASYVHDTLKNGRCFTAVDVYNRNLSGKLGTSKLVCKWCNAVMQYTGITEAFFTLKSHTSRHELTRNVGLYPWRYSWISRNLNSILCRSLAPKLTHIINICGKHGKCLYCI